MGFSITVVAAEGWGGRRKMVAAAIEARIEHSEWIDVWQAPIGKSALFVLTVLEPRPPLDAVHHDAVGGVFALGPRLVLPGVDEAVPG